VILSLFWARFLAADLFYSIFCFIRVFWDFAIFGKILLNVKFSAILARLVGAFQQLLFIDNFIEFKVFLCFWGEFLVFFIANYLLISLQNNRYYVRPQLVSKLQHFPETSSSSVLMAGGRGGHCGQVPNEEAPHRDRNVQDVMIEDLQRQVAELA
jgi:hypothetical protein